MSSIIRDSISYSKLSLEEIKKQVIPVLSSFLNFAKEIKQVLENHNDFEITSGSHYLNISKKIRNGDIDDGVAYALERWMCEQGCRELNYESIKGYISYLESLIDSIEKYTTDELNSELCFYGNGRVERRYADGRVVQLFK